MQIPPVPGDEQQRLRGLYDLHLLDTEPEERFDRLTRLATQMFDVPIALVSLVDKQRQWFKSRQGLDSCETSRDVSFCAHAILGEDIFEICDATQDIRFADNPLVSEAPHIRFYAGAPLVTGKGDGIGTLCIIDPRPRQLNASERQSLRDLANIVVSEIERVEEHRQSQELSAARKLTLVISRAQSRFIHGSGRRRAFAELLADIIDLTDSEFGFIGEVESTDKDSSCLTISASTISAWSDEKRVLCARSVPQNTGVFDINSLVGSALKTGEPVIADDSQHEFRRTEVTDAHPRLTAFLGVPIYHGSDCVAMLGLANRAGGYGQDVIGFLSPLLLTIGQLVVAARVQQLRHEDQLELARLSQVASQTTNGVVITDVSGRVEWINEGFTRLTGYAIHEMLGKKPGELLQGAETDPKTVQSMRDALAQGQAFKVDVVNYGRERDPYWVRIQCNPMRSADGVLQGFIAIESDITHEKEAAQRVSSSERRLASVIEGTNIGTWEWNLQTGQVIFNERWAEIIGHTLEALEPVSVETWKRLLHPDDIGPTLELLDRHLAGEVDFYDCVVRMRHKEGHWVWVHNCGRVVSRSHDGHALLISGTHADITNQKQAEEELRSAKRMLEVILENVPSMIFLKEATDLRFKYFNRAGEALVGRERDEMIGRNDYDFFPREQADFFMRKDRSALAQTGVIDIPEEEIDTHHGKRILHTRKLALCDEKGKPEYLLGISDDITSERQAAEALLSSEARLRGLFELSPIGIALSDYESGVFLELNESLLRPTGYTRDELSALSRWDVTPKEYRALDREQFDSLVETGRYGPYEKEYIRKDGSRFPILVSGMLIRDKSRKLIWSIIEDISERKRIERMKGEFVSIVSHELRTPLTSISGALRLILGGAAGELPPRALQMVTIACKNSESLALLINDLLDIDKMEAEKLRFDMQEHSLISLIDQSLQNHLIYAGEQSVTFTLENAVTDATVQVDSQRFEQVMANLLSNAVKFSPEGGIVTISVSPMAENVRVNISDHGPGIPEEFHARIFEKFSQADTSDTRQKGGTGLGLAITRELVKRMHGHIGFDSVLGDGTTFWFELPLIDHGGP